MQRLAEEYGKGETVEELMDVDHTLVWFLSLHYLLPFLGIVLKTKCMLAILIFVQNGTAVKNQMIPF